MTKTLVIVAHPNIEQSMINRRWVNEMQKRPDLFTVHKLYDLYPDYQIDVAAEQQLVAAHDKIVFQFPVQWFNCPPLLKQWLDDVLTFGWAYGPGGTALQGKKIGLAVSCAQPATSYSPTGIIGYTLIEILRPFELLISFIDANYQPLFSFHAPSMEHGYDQAALQELEHSAASYSMHLSMYFVNG